MRDSYFDFNGNTWYCISIYYTRKDYYKLMPRISSFCLESTPKYHLLFLSDYLGDHINLAFSFSEVYDKELIKREISDYFSSMVSKIPSHPSKETAYGDAFWMNYPNNCIVWNRFEIPRHIILNQDLLEFTDSTSLLLTHLIDEELESEEGFLSLAIFLFINLSQAEVFSGDKFCQTITALFDENESLYLKNLEVLDTYVVYSDDTFDPMFKIWIEKAGKVLSAFGRERGVVSLLNVINQQLGLRYSNNLIVNPVIAWSKARETLNNEKSNTQTRNPKTREV